MTIDRITGALAQALTEVQECNGYLAPDISEDTCPIGHLEGFDSMNVVECAQLVSQALGKKISYKVVLPKSRHQSLSVREIAQRIYDSAGGVEGASR